MSSWSAALALAIALPCAAQTADAGVPDAGPADAGAADAGPSQDDAALEKELQESLSKGAPKAPGANGQQPAPPAATEPPGILPPQLQGTLARGAQSLNPDISAIIDADFGYQRRPLSLLAGDDPFLNPVTGRPAAGPQVQEVELAFSAIVDPYFKGEVYLTIPNLNGLEVEEAFATTTSLPWNLQVKAGSSRSIFGRQNGQHLHIQDFTFRPLINAAFLGIDGLRGAAAQVSWLTPMPFYLALFGEVRRPNPPGAPPAVGAGEFPLPAPVQTFGGGTPTDLTYVGAAKAFYPIGDEWSVYAGASYARGISPGVLVPDTPAAPGFTAGAGRRTTLLGGDLYVKWKPANIAQGYYSVAWQSEAIFRRFAEGGGLPSEWDGGLYSQVVAQIERRWFLGVRGDWIGVPTSSVLGRTLRAALSLTFQPSEFARVRGYAAVENSSSASDPVSFGGAETATSFIPVSQPGTALVAFLQLEISIGAHGAHPF